MKPSGATGHPSGTSRTPGWRLQNPGAYPSPRDRYTIGSGQTRVSPICLGAVGDPRIIRLAYDAGINFFSITTDLHWPFYDAARRGLRDLVENVPCARNDIVVMGVSYMCRPSLCHVPFQELLDSEPWLRHVDLSAAGAVTDADFLPRWNEHLKHKGDTGPQARAVAAMFDSNLSCFAALKFGLVDLAVVGYRPSLRGAETEVFDRLAGAARPPLYVQGRVDEVLSDEQYRSLGVPTTKWRPSAQDYCRYSFSRPEVDGVLFVPGSESDLRALLDGLEKGPLSSEEKTYLEDLSDLTLGLAELVR